MELIKRAPPDTHRRVISNDVGGNGRRIMGMANKNKMEHEIFVRKYKDFLSFSLNSFMVPFRSADTLASQNAPMGIIT